MSSPSPDFLYRFRKSTRPSSVLIDSAVVSLSHLLAIEFGSKKSPEFLSESVLLRGAFSFVPSVSESSKTVCLELLCRLLEDEYRVGLPDVLAALLTHDQLDLEAGKIKEH
ncbi:hypothetical protein SADUNF_Sadunf10G0189800 [Salix dunnii]|uniref:Uncharacterized protein n=1 Tax=Salix dunnii TaxID=1413687 RepID=A0A835MVJ3_9ROSI|nr:hypothetical protein SADUNF_Sadunf10G0189800 [Salix dunnii]